MVRSIRSLGAEPRRWIAYVQAAPGGQRFPWRSGGSPLRREFWHRVQCGPQLRAWRRTR